jgi:hypothetical protein
LQALSRTSTIAASHLITRRGIPLPLKRVFFRLALPAKLYSTVKRGLLIVGDSLKSAGYLARAEEMREAKIISLKKSIAKLESMKF